MLDDYDYKLENEQLRLKIKKLQSEIAQRTRNFMQHSKNKSKFSLTKLSEVSIQTEDITEPQEPDFYKLACYDEVNSKISFSQKNPQPVDCGSPQKMENQAKQLPVKSNQNSNQTHICTTQKEQQDLGEKNLLEKITQNTNTQNCMKIQMLHKSQKNIKQLKSNQITKSNINIQIKQGENQIDQLNIQNGKLKQKIQKINGQLKKSQARCQFITKNLIQTEQINYQLRLKNQQYELRLKKSCESINAQTTKSFQTTIQQLKSKLCEMEVMKKQYLRAYSKVKQEKQGLQLRVMELVEELQRKNNHETSISQPYHSSERHASSHQQAQQIFSQQIEQQNRLKTIIEHSQDELIEEMLKKNPSQNSIGAIKQIIQHGLLQSNRSTSQKWIKSALVKLDQYENTQNQHNQKMTDSQANLQSNLHQKYKHILMNVQKAMAKQKFMMQQKFNETINKLIIKFSEQSKLGHQNQNPPKSPTLTAKKPSKPHIEESVVNSMSQLDSIPMQQSNNKKNSQEPQQNSQTLQLMIKLSQAHTRYAQLKKKYDDISVISSKKQNTTQIASLRQQKNYYDIKQFMNKLVQMKPVKINQKFTQQYFDKLSHKVFETLCNLPTGGHGNIYFIPSNQQQLQDALEVIYKFSLQFDKLQQSHRKQFKKQTEGLTKVLQEIVIEGEVPTQKVIQCIHHNIGEQNPMSGTIMQSLIKKISHESNKNKVKQTLSKSQQYNNFAKIQVKQQTKLINNY